jgi:hypothetical protein
MSIDSVPAHEIGALRLSIQPGQDDVVLTSGQDGFVKLFDFRAPTKNQGAIDSLNSQNGVQFNPVLPHLFVTCDDNGKI